MRIDEFEYALPAERIAQQPLPERDASLLLLRSADGAISDHTFTELPDLLQPGDLLVANDTRVRRARLRGSDAEGHAVELLLLEHLAGDDYSCLTRPARRLTEGVEVSFGGALRATITGRSNGHASERTVRLHVTDGDVASAVREVGEAPLPPYIRGYSGDPERYQTVYAQGAPESAAAPTAGLHFTPRVLDALSSRGVEWTTVRLDVGLGTFAPMRGERVEEHEMHRERYEVTEQAAAAVARTRARGGRVIAVGTTVVRVLETCTGESGVPRAGGGSSQLFIRPGHSFRAVDGMLTNFHQPRSSLLVLLAAFIGDGWRDAYAHALAGGYRFLSFGDCMLCWPPP